ncbi:MAG: EF-Tu/IF-2/RF-3 family GTPase, partial [Planctomycetota bacterium]
ALGYNLRPLVVINKIDRPEARCAEVLNEVFDLFVELNATDEQLDFTVNYASGREGYAKMSLDEANKDITPLLDTILKYVPKPSGDASAPLQMQIAALDYNDYVGRIGIGRITRGTISVGQQVVRIDKGGNHSMSRVTELFTFTGLGRQPIKSAMAGDIVAISGIENIDISDTLASPEKPEAMPQISIDEPTLSMIFSVNNSPFCGQDGKYVTSRNLRERLYRELRANVALKVEDTASPDALRVSGRGLLHLSVLIENMRREGYELQVSKPKVIFKELKGEKAEPVEYVVIDVPKDYEGQAISMLGSRKGEMLTMDTNKNITHFEFKVPSRGLIGLRNRLLSATRGEAVMYHNFYNYEPFKGEIAQRIQGVLVSMAGGEATPYSLDSLKD